MSRPAESPWDDLVAVALVGTERRGLPERVRDVAQVPAEGPVEGQVLTAAALLGGGRRAGWIPPAAPVASAAPAPDADVRVAPEAAAQVLELLVSGAVSVPGGPDGLVGEWLARCARRGLRVPERLLPAVLDRAAANPMLREAATVAAGERGRWLAALNERWSWARVDFAADADHAAVWETGSPEARLALLRRLRRVDPDAGRALIESTWGSETASERAAFLRVVHDTGPTDRDEPFLEAALDDRAPTVRRLAAAALDGLPSSRRAARMAARAAPLVRVEGRFRTRLAVDLPETPDASARRDGVGDEGRAGRGRRAWWLVQIITGTPLRFWHEHLGRPPAELVGLAGDAAELVDGWARAAIRQRDPEWAELLLPRRPAQHHLLGVLSPASAERAVTPLLRGRRLTAHQTMALLEACPGPWSSSLSRLVVDRLRAAGDKPGPLLQSATALAASLDPSVAPDLDAWIAQLGDAGSAARDARRLHHALTLRASIAKELP